MNGARNQGMREPLELGKRQRNKLFLIASEETVLLLRILTFRSIVCIGLSHYFCDLFYISEIGNPNSERVNDNLLQYSYLRKSHGQWSLAGNSPCGHRESDMIEATERSNREVINTGVCCFLIIPWSQLSPLFFWLKLARLSESLEFPELPSVVKNIKHYKFRD